jgi:phospholipase D1/2
LTGGRYDNPIHPLFETLKTDHDGDFRNSNAKTTPPYAGPREPWHDIHCKVEESFYEYINLKVNYLS